MRSFQLGYRVPSSQILTRLPQPFELFLHEFLRADDHTVGEMTNAFCEQTFGGKASGFFPLEQSI